MSETITLHALDLSGETTLKLFLRKDDGTLLNTGGDALTEISSSGVFTATLGEARTGLGTLAVRVCDGTETADNLLIDDFLPESSTVIGAKVNAELDSATQTQLDNIENTAAQRAFGIVERPPSDTGVITFVWPALGATITGTVSLNNASYIPVIGAFEFLRTDGGKYFYTLAYNTADRPVSAGSARYALTDGTYTRYLVLRVVESGDTGETTALAVLCFDWEAVTGEVPSRSVLNALRHIRNKWALDGNTKTVYAEDDTTPAYTTSVTADGAGNIIADTPD